MRCNIKLLCGTPQIHLEKKGNSARRLHDATLFSKTNNLIEFTFHHHTLNSPKNGLEENEDRREHRHLGRKDESIKTGTGGNNPRIL